MVPFISLFHTGLLNTAKGWRWEMVPFISIFHTGLLNTAEGWRWKMVPFISIFHTRPQWKVEGGKWFPSFPYSTLAYWTQWTLKGGKWFPLFPYSALAYWTQWNVEDGKRLISFYDIPHWLAYWHWYAAEIGKGWLYSSRHAQRCWTLTSRCCFHGSLQSSMVPCTSRLVYSRCLLS